MPPDLRYTLCFLTRGETVLMLHRRFPPNRGLWNGVGGRLEPGETPLRGALREVEEETGFRLESLTPRGILTWEGFETLPGGLYLFTAEAPAGEPRQNNEGDLAWQPIAWACAAPEVVSNLHIVLPRLLRGDPPARYHFVYAGGEITHYWVKRIGIFFRDNLKTKKHHIKKEN